MRGPEFVGLKTFKTIQAIMFKVTDYVSLCTEKGRQALEAFNFLLDMVQTFYALINPIKI